MDYPTKEKKTKELLMILRKGEKISSLALGVSENDFHEIVYHSKLRGFIDGVIIKKTTTGIYPSFLEDVSLTSLGVSYL